VPKLFSPYVACPCCGYPNDEHFHFCQQCGYARRTLSGSTADGAQPKLDIDEVAITSRVQQLSQQRLSSKYAKQKTALEKELVNILLNRHPPKTVMSALPGDVIAFLVWKDRNGRTQVHQPTCLVARVQGVSHEECECPKRLAFGTIDSLIGKLRSIFCNIGRGSECIRC